VPFKPLDERYWLERASEAYALAERMAHPQARRVMLEIAAGYQRLAQQTEERSARYADRPIKKGPP
jgi:CHASE3 domain sensor protein